MLPFPLNDRRLRHLPLRPLPLLLLVALAEPVSAQTAVIAPSTTQTTCPAGVMRCVAPKNDYGKCKRNDLLDFFVAGLPPAGDRSKAQSVADANKVTWTDKNHAQLEDDVRMQRLDALLRTDFLTYNSETTDYVATGHVRYQDAGMLMSADKARGTTTPSVTYLDNVRYQMLDQRGNGVAKTVNQTDPDHSKMSYGTFSTCDPSERQWEMRANDLEIDRVKNEGYGHGVTLAYEGVPFMWLPYMSFPIDEGRQSGFLMPVLGYSNRRGFKLGIPYYLNLAPNYDLTLKPIEYTKRGPLLDTEFRYLSEWDRLMINVGYMPKDDVTDETSRGYLRLQNWTTFNANWGATVDVHRVSDNRYLRDYGDSFQSTAISLLPSSAYVNGNGGWWNIAIGGDTWQVSDPSMESVCPTGGPLEKCANPVVFKPYTRLPRVAFNILPQTYSGFEVGMESEYINFQRSFSLTGRRLDMYPHISYPIESLAWFVRPTVGYRITQYDLSDMRYNTNALITNTSPSRHLPIASVDSGLFFERDTKLFDKAYIQTLEPRLFYLWVPYRNQDNLPSFDTSVPSLDFPSLFRTNSFTGSDRQSDANQATVALTSRLIDADSGDQLVSGSIGQIRYFKTPRVSLYANPVPPLRYSGRDIFTELQVNINKRWSLTWDMQWNPDPVALDPVTQKYVATSKHTDLGTVSVQHRFGTDGVINLAYHYRRNFLQTYDATALIPLNLRWSIVGRYYYSVNDKRLLESFAGVQYDSCCVAARLVARRWLNNVSNPYSDAVYVPNNVKAESTVFFEIEFKGIGASGQRTQNFLRHAILGYQ